MGHASGQYVSDDVGRRVGIAVLVYGANQRHAPLLGRLSLDGIDMRDVVVVFNPSPQHREPPPVPDGAQVVAMADNVGYAAAVNRGLLSLDGCDAFLICTDDLRLQPGAADALIDHVLTPGTGPAGPVLFRTGTDEVFSAGGVLGEWHRPRHRTEVADPTLTHEVDWLDGACIAVSKATWHEVGAFDEKFFLYGEDVEWGLRAQDRGRPCAIVPMAVGSQEAGAEQATELFGYLGMRNGLAVCRGRGSRGEFIVRLLQDLRMTVIRALLRRDGPMSRRIGFARILGIIDALRGRLGPPPPHLHPGRSTSHGAGFSLRAALGWRARRVGSELTKGLRDWRFPIRRRRLLRALASARRRDRCVVLGNGPSLGETPLECLTGEDVWTVNRGYLLWNEVPWRPRVHLVQDRLAFEENVDDLASLVTDFPDTMFLFPEEAWLDDRRFRRRNVHWYPLQWADPMKVERIPAVSRRRFPRFGVTGMYTVVASAIQLSTVAGYQIVALAGCDNTYSSSGKVIDVDPDTGVETLVGVQDQDHFSPAYRRPGERFFRPPVGSHERSMDLAAKAVSGSAQIVNATVGGALELFERVDFGTMFCDRSVS